MLIKKHIAGPIALVAHTSNRGIIIRTSKTPLRNGAYIVIKTAGRTAKDVMADAQKAWDRCVDRCNELIIPGRCNTWPL